MSDLLKTLIQDLVNDRTEQAQVTVHQYLVAKVQSMVSEAKADTKTIYVEVSGRWFDNDYSDVDGFAVYPVDVPADAVDKIVAALGDGKYEEDLVDTFEQDGWEPRDAEGHATDIQLDDVSMTMPSGAKKIKKNFYTMVYFLRDRGLLSKEYAESIAKT